MIWSRAAAASSGVMSSRRCARAARRSGCSISRRPTISPRTSNSCRARSSIRERLGAAMADVRHVYHLAGIAKLWSRDRADFDRINAGGTAMVHARGRRAPRRARRALLDRGDPAAEAPRHRRARSTRRCGRSFADMPGPYTRSKLAAEQAVLAAVQGGLERADRQSDRADRPRRPQSHATGGDAVDVPERTVAGLSRLRAQSGRRARRCGRHGARGGARAHRRALHPRRRERRAARPAGAAGADIGAADAEARGAAGGWRWHRRR